MTDVADSAASRLGALKNAALSDVGLRRGNNQDAFTISLASDDAEWRARGHLFVVADGMGAHAAGELASKMACEAVAHTYRKLADRPAAEALRQAVLAANASIHDRGQANAEFQGMGTTCSALVLLPRTAIVAHVGDSRVYRLRRGTLDQLTFDHSLVWEMTAAGQMPRGEAANFIPKNIITRSLGPHPDVQVDLEGPFPLESGDAFLVCSDGLSGQLKDEEIGALLVALSPAEAVRALIDVANLRGGPDNVTAIVVRVGDVPVADWTPSSPEPADSAAVAVHPLLLGAMALCLLLALVLAVTENYIPALVSVLLAAVFAVVVLVHNLTATAARASARLEGPLGNGPHGTHDCLPSAESAAVAAALAQQLREATRAEHWTLDWARFDTLGEKAQAALARGDYTAAVRHNALAISFMMDEIRRQGARKDHRDSSVLDW
jgi:protein phosphatase